MSGKEADRLQRDAVDGGKGDERRPKGVEIVDAGASLAGDGRLALDRNAEATGAAMSVDGVAAVPFAYQLAVPVFSKLDSHGLIQLEGRLVCKVKQRGPICYFSSSKSRWKIHKNRHKHSTYAFCGLEILQITG